MLEPMFQNMCNCEHNNISRYILFTGNSRIFNKIATYNSVEIIACFEKNTFLSGKKAECVRELLEDLRQTQRVKACNVPLITAKLSEPPAPQEVTSFSSCDYLISSSLCSYTAQPHDLISGN